MKKIVFFTILAIISVIIFLFIRYDGFFVLKENNKNIKESAKIINGSLGVYLINLKKDKDRYKYASILLNKSFGKFERIDAIYGKELKEEEKNKIASYEKYYRYNGKKLGDGTIGCSLSHLKTWKTFLESQHEFAIIFEDDVEFEENYKKDFKKIIDEIIKNNETWDIVLLERGHGHLPLRVKKINHNLSLNIYLDHVSHAAAYILNRHAARELVKYSLPLKMINDHYFRRTWEMNNLKFLAIEPSIAYQRYIKSSRISIDAKNEEKFVLSSTVYVVKTSIAEFLSNLNTWIKIKIKYR